MKNKVLVISKGVIHPSILSRYSLRKLLSGLEGEFSFTFTSKLRALGSLKKEDFKGVILYFQAKEISDDIITKFGGFVSEGGGVLAIHASMASFKANKKYQEILGGRFLKHGKIGDIEVTSKAENLGISIEPIPFCVRDELYIHEYDGNNNILLVSGGRGKEEPILWTKTHGRGRVAYFSLGHCPKTFKNKAVVQIIEGILGWVTNLREDIWKS